MRRASPTARPGRTAQRTVVTTILLAATLFLYQLTGVQPGALAAGSEATSIPSADASSSPTPAPAASIDPSPSVDPSPTDEPTTAPVPDPAPSQDEPTPSANPEPTLPAPVSDSLSVSHFTFARVAGPPDEPTYLAQDTALTDVSRFAVIRLRFEIANASADSYTWTPLIQVAQDGGEFADLAESADAAWPFHAAAEWVAAAGGGTELGPALVNQPATADAPVLLRSSGLNPLPVQTMPGSSTLNIEFSIGPTAGATYDTTYVFRLTDAGTELAASAGDPSLTMASMPPLELSPGQRPGVPAGGDAVNGANGPTVTRPDLSPSSASVHVPEFDLTGSSCSICHRAHSAAGSGLTTDSTQLGLCGTCHNGTDLPDVAAEFSSVPANDDASRSYFKHDATDLCSQCHNPHDSNSTPGVESAGGWTPSGATYGASGAAVSNPAGGPVYQLVGRIALEYQLCFKCHSGANASLPSNAGQPPSHQLLDKGIEFNPANLSYHPIEAAGTNATTAMGNSLIGTSPYKLWNFTPASTIRCVNCHADANILSAAIANSQTVLAGDPLSVHASSERGILIGPYQDRLLNGPLETYQAADFALCYVCHSEAPFVDQSGSVRVSPNDTNFRYHGVHLSNTDVMGDRGFNGTDIDTPGYGSGLAICAECHYRIHSSAYPVDGKAPGPRLVNFAPDVTAPTGGTLDWQPRSDTTLGSCTLKCHGAPHHAVQY